MKVINCLKNGIKGTIIGQFILAKQYVKYKGLEEVKYVYNLSGKMNQFSKVLSNLKNQDLCENDFFYYTIDQKCVVTNCYRIISNMSIDYSKVISTGLFSLVNNEESTEIVEQNNQLLHLVISFVKTLKEKFETANGSNSVKHKMNFEKMLYHPADSLEDAFQRILLWNQFLWQTRHNLMGLGRLDKVLWDAYCQGKCKNEDALEVIKEFLKAIHKFYDFKSAELRGDTGQVIVLGGLEPDGSYFCNELSYLFLRALRELHLPDPKFILRVSKAMPDELLEEAMMNLASGLGNPLLSNDDIIVPCLEAFYEDRLTACDYVTTACWAPVANGNAISQCNLRVGNFAEPFHKMMNSEKLENVTSFSDLLHLFYSYLDNYWERQTEFVDSVNWEKDILLTFFVKGCCEKNKDISQGGAKYNDYGMQSIGLANVVNSLYFIYKYVFQNREISLSEVKDIINNDYKDADEWLFRLKNEEVRFGNDVQDIVKLTNSIIRHSVQSVSEEKNRYGEKIKIGLSSPAFITTGNKTAATFDGRKAGAPLGVQISSDKEVSYTELTRFASKLDYSEWCSNGNVVDFIITQNIIENQFKKVLEFIKSCIRIGVYQIQINVLSYSCLLDAKKHPEKYTNLIVRVWGFNAYFNDLPEEYKDLLIQRAKDAEKGM